MSITSFLNTHPYQKIISIIKETARSTGASVYIVGGAVRNILINYPVHDLDFVVFGINYIDFARKCAEKLHSNAVLFKQNVRIPHHNKYIDISEPRGINLEEDLAKRDFTVNNLACTLDGELIGDTEDLKAMLIRPVYNDAFTDDPLRILRGYRMVAEHGYCLSSEFNTLVTRDLHLLPTVSKERITEELQRITLGENDVFDMLLFAGVWEEILGFRPNITVNTNIRKYYRGFGKDEIFALYLAPMIGPYIKKVQEKLTLSTTVQEYIKKLINNFPLSAEPAHIKISVWKNRSFFYLLMAFAEIKGTPKALINNYAEVYNSMNIERSDLINGNEVLKIASELGLDTRAGKWIAEVLSSAKVKLAHGDLQNKEEAKELVKQELKKYFYEYS